MVNMIEVLKQTLEALYPISHNSTDDYRGQADKAITSLRQAIAELESQEPVAWSYWQSCLNDDGTQTAPWAHRLSKFKPHESIINKDVIPLYTHPPQRPRAVFPTMLRKMWSGGEVQAWLDENVNKENT